LEEGKESMTGRIVKLIDLKMKVKELGSYGWCLTLNRSLKYYAKCTEMHHFIDSTRNILHSPSPAIPLQREHSFTFNMLYPVSGT